MKKKAIFFTSDLYHQNYYFLKDWTREELEKALGLDSGGAGGLTVLKEDSIFIWVEQQKGEGVSHLVHECQHATNFTLGTRGVKIKHNNDEAQAYLIQWIFWNCYKHLIKARK